MVNTSRVLVVGASVAVTAGAALYASPFETGADEQDASLPLAATNYVLGDDLDTYDDFTMSGGPPKDGIPSIDEPRFVDADQADLAPGDLVIGFEHDGDARAYPQHIVVYHEIVNDRVGGLNVAVTYCPLTATAQVFERGETTLGTSGRLLNSNLVMYDRETDSFCSQMAATCYRGDHTGETLVEHDAVWTTWERWRSVHPDTRVLTDDTGHVYATGDEGPEVSAAGDGAYELDGQTYAAADLPLDRQVSLEAFFFAWNAFYPESETPS